MDAIDLHISSTSYPPFLQDFQSDPCQVCSEQSSGWHCGAVTCEACKKFFLRSINEEYLKYKCVRDKKCLITRSTRTQCQYCRYQKCIQVGMKINEENQNSKIEDIFKQIPCSCCTAPSSGIHFGAMTCEGCKGFFRRTMKERTSQRYTCLESNNCEINTSTRNICRACRFQKCINAGMSIEGSRIGRQSNLFKQKMLSMQKTGNIPSSLLNALTNNDYGMRTFGNNLRYNKTIDKSVSIVNMEEKLEPHVRSLISIIEEAYCNNIKEIPSCIDKMNIWDTCISQLEEYAKRIMNFSTEIPGFSTFAHSDHLLLIRSSVHSVILLCLCTQALQYHSQHLLYSRDYQRQSDQQYHLNLINNNNNNNQIDWNYFNAHESDLCERLQINFSVFFEIKRIMFHSIENELEHLELDDKELSLTLALLITSTVNSKLIDQKKIEQLQVDLFCALADYMDAKRGTNNKDYYVLTIQIPIIRRINSIIASSIYHLNSVCPQPFRIPKFFLQDDLLDQNRLEHNHDNFLF